MHKSKKVHTYTTYLLFLTLSFLSACYGQEKPKSAEKEQYDSGLFSLNKKPVAKQDSSSQIAEYVVELFEDRKGNLWMSALGKGAARYDGQSLVYFSIADGLAGNDVTSIAEDREGNLWFGTHTGASRYDGKTFTNFGSKEGLHGAGCNILVDRKGTIWAGTNAGVFRFDGKAFAKFYLPKPEIKQLSTNWEAGKVWSLIEDRKGNIWFGRDGYGACRFDGQSFTHFTTEDGLCNNNVSCIREDRDGNIWFGSISSNNPQVKKDGGLSVYDGQTIRQFPEEEGLKGHDIYCIYVDPAANVWIGANGHGVYKYNGQAFTIYKGTDRMDLTYNFGVQSMLKDSKGILWLGFSGGLFRINGDSIVNVTKRDF